MRCWLTPMSWYPQGGSCGVSHPRRAWWAIPRPQAHHLCRPGGLRRCQGDHRRRSLQKEKVPPPPPSHHTVTPVCISWTCLQCTVSRCMLCPQTSPGMLSACVWRAPAAFYWMCVCPASTLRVTRLARCPRRCICPSRSGTCPAC